MTRLEIRTLIRKRLGETTAAFWSDVELNNWTDDAGHYMAFFAKCIRAQGDITTTADTREYGLTSNFSNFLAVREIYFYQDGTTWRKLTQTTRDKLNRRSSGWKSADTATPQEYYWDREEDILGLNPSPDSDNVGTGYIELYYAQDYTDMTLDGDTPTVPFPLQLAMVDYVVSIGYETRGWGDKANDARAKCDRRITDYKVERDTEKEADDGIQMVNYRNR